jgi:hypothetical protein
LTDFDPFENAPLDADEPTPFEEPAPKPARKPKTNSVAVDGTSKAKVTLKGGPGYDVPWIPLVYGSIDEAHADLTNPETKRKLAELFEVVAKANTLFAKKVSEFSPQKPKTVGGAPTRPGQEAPAGTPEPPGPDWVYKTGVNAKTGKAWKAWMPPRGSDENPVWL